MSIANRSVFILFALLCGTLLKGQEIIIKENLNWKNVAFGSKSIPTFDAQRGEISFRDEVPFYSLSLGNLDASEKFEVKLVSAVYEPAGLLVPSAAQQGQELTVNYTWEKKIKSGVISINPYRINSNTKNAERLVSFELQVAKVVDQALRTSGGTFSKAGSWASSSLLASGKWIKINVSKTGIYKLDYNFLNGTGLPVSGAKVGDIKLYGYGGGMLPEANNSPARKDDLVENAIKVIDENGNGNFDQEDYILFYGEAPLTWNYTLIGKTYNHQQHLYSDKTSYFINVNSTPGKRIASQPNDPGAANYTSNAYDYLYLHELENTNLIKTGRRWYGEAFDKDLTYSFNVNIPNRRTNEPVVIKTIGVARSTTDCAFEVYANGQAIMSNPINGIYFDYDKDYIDFPVERETTFSTPSQNLNIRYDFIKTSSDALAWLDYFEILARCDLYMGSAQMVFSDQSTINAGRITDFQINNAGKNIRVWEVTDKLNIREQQLTNNGNTTSFTLATTQLRTFIAFDGSSFESIDNWENVDNQDLHSLQGIDMVIVSAPDLLEEARKLAEYRSNKSGISVTVVTPQQIYNEFSSGVQDISAIRNFMKMLYDKATLPEEMPKYLLLFGNASYDYKQRIPNNSNTVPTYESDNSHSPTRSYASDDYFALLDDAEGTWFTDEKLDIAVGRIPAKTIDQARIAIDKIKRYEATASFGKWRNTVAFFGDDGDGNQHVVYFEESEKEIAKEAPYVNIDKIYIDAYKQVEVGNGQRCPEASNKLDERFNKGALVISYLGHGGGQQLTHEEVMNLPMINAFANMNNMPLFTTATCEFTRYDDPGEYPAGEQLFFNPKGGAISLITTSRLIYIGPHGNITEAIFKENLFKKVNGRYPTQGEVNSTMKNEVNQDENERCIILAGDPSMTLAYPKYNVVTNEINGNAAVDTTTVGALGKIEIRGEVQDESGNKLSGFNGSINITVYDKPSTITTKGDESSPLTFKAYNNIIFNGKYSVNNGDFAATFIVPKDISYESGIGKISYYASNDTVDATGSYNELMVTGTDPSAVYESNAPQVRLYMNDTTFRFGGYTNEHPSLLALVYDESGVNTSNTGIGREITAVLDENMQQVLVLSDYYEAELNSYQYGVVKYPFKDLSEGKHSLKLKVWDVQNNSAEAYTEFIVVKDGKAALEKIFNYPNPFSDQTTFSFQHNQSDRFMQVSIEIVDLKGVTVRTLEGSFNDPNATFEQITWDGRTEGGMLVPQGIYVYRITLSTESGVKAYQSEKLVVIRP